MERLSVFLTEYPQCGTVYDHLMYWGWGWLSRSRFIWKLFSRVRVERQLIRDTPCLLVSLSIYKKLKDIQLEN